MHTEGDTTHTETGTAGVIGSNKDMHTEGDTTKH